jgi:hypothetical protein
MRAGIQIRRNEIQARRNEIQGKRNEIKIAFLAADRALSKGCARFLSPSVDGRQHFLFLLSLGCWAPPWGKNK